MIRLGLSAEIAVPRGILDLVLEAELHHPRPDVAVPVRPRADAGAFARDPTPPVAPVQGLPQLAPELLRRPVLGLQELRGGDDAAFALDPVVEPALHLQVDDLLVRAQVLTALRGEQPVREVEDDLLVQVTELVLADGPEVRAALHLDPHLAERDDLVVDDHADLVGDVPAFGGEPVERGFLAVPCRLGGLGLGGLGVCRLE